MTAYSSSPTIAEAFDLFQSRLELDASYDEVVRQNYHAVKTLMENNVPGSRTQLIGSLQRKTKIDPLNGLAGFDVDVLVELGGCNRFVPQWTGGISSGDALRRIEDVTAGTRRYAAAVTDAPTISVPYRTGAKVEVVPAYRDNLPERNPRGRAFWVPGDGRWLSADYNYDAQYISQINATSGGRLVPLIKVLKAWRREHVDGILRSYHLEVMAAEAILGTIQLLQNNGRPLNTQFLTWGFFSSASTRSQVPGTLSESADYYMDELDRYAVESEMGRCEQLSRSAIDRRGDYALDAWREIFGNPFPGA